MPTREATGLYVTVTSSPRSVAAGAGGVIRFKVRAIGITSEVVMELVGGDGIFAPLRSSSTGELPFTVAPSVSLGIKHMVLKAVAVDGLGWGSTTFDLTITP